LFTVVYSYNKSLSFTEPNASHDPVGEGWVRHDRLRDSCRASACWEDM